MKITFRLNVNQDLALDFEPLQWNSGGEIVDDEHELLDDGPVIDRGWQLSSLTAWPCDNGAAWAYDFGVDVCAQDHQRHCLIRTSTAGPDLDSRRFASQHDAVQALVTAALVV